MHSSNDAKCNELYILALNGSLYRYRSVSSGIIWSLGKGGFGVLFCNAFYGEDTHVARSVVPGTVSSHLHA